jgi:hypothetical protein
MLAAGRLHRVITLRATDASGEVCGECSGEDVPLAAEFRGGV